MGTTTVFSSQNVAFGSVGVMVQFDGDYDEFIRLFFALFGVGVMVQFDGDYDP